MGDCVPEDSQTPGSLRRRGACSVAGAVAFLAYGLAVLLWSWPLPKRMAVETVGFAGDTALNAYIIGWDQHSFLHDPLNLFNPNFFHPLPHAIALSENLIGAALITLPLAPLGNPVLVYNVLLLLSSWLSGFAWWAVLRRWGVHGLAAWLGGAIFAFLPWRLGQLGHVQLLYTWWIPIALAAGENWTREGSPRSGVLAGCAMAASFYTCVYNTYFLLLYLLPFAGIGLIWSLPARDEWRRWARQRAVSAALGAGVALLLIAPALPAYLDINRTLGTPTNLKMIARRGAAFRDYLDAGLHGGPTSRFLPPTRPNPYSDVPWEHQLFLGWTGMIGAAAFIPMWVFRRNEFSKDGNRRLAWLSLMMAAGGLALFVISLGPRLHWRGETTSIRLPYAFLYNNLPGFEALRVPTRAALFVGLSLSGIAALTLHGVLTLYGGWKRSVGYLATGIALTLLGLESFHWSFPINGSPLYERHLKIQKAIAGMPRGAVLVLPLDDDLNYMAPLTTLPHCYPLVNGVSGHLTPSNGQIFDLLRSSDWGERQAELIRFLEIRYVVVDMNLSASPGKEFCNRLESVLADLGFDAKAETDPEAHLKLITLENAGDSAALAASGPPKLDLSHTLNWDKRPVEVYAWLRNASAPVMVEGEARWIKVKIEGENSEEEVIWNKEWKVPLPSFWMRDQSIGIRIRIPRSKSHDTARIKLRLHHHAWEVKVKRTIPLDPP